MGGLRYTFIKFNISAGGEDLPDFISKINFDVLSSTITPVLFYDSRDNIFTPDKGMLAKVACNLNGSWIGSDFDYQLLETHWLGYIPIRSKYFIGLRYAGYFSSEETPFFAQPFINLRGIPLMRYQSKNALELETEHRWNVTSRWALIGFAGLGKVYYDKESFSEIPEYWAGGGGFRYLLARAYNLWAGIDVARGPDNWAFYITVGSAWSRY